MEFSDGPAKIAGNAAAQGTGVREAARHARASRQNPGIRFEISVSDDQACSTPAAARYKMGCRRNVNNCSGQASVLQAVYGERASARWFQRRI